MLTQFLTVFYGLFVALSVGYVLLQRRQRRQRRVVWAAVYVLLIEGLAELMNRCNQQFVGKGIYLDVGHAGTLLVIVWLSWFFLAVQVILYMWFALPKKK